MGNKPLYHSCLFSIFSCVRTKCTKCVECVLSVIANRKNWVWGILACWTSFLSQAYLTNQFLHNFQNTKYCEVQYMPNIVMRSFHIFWLLRQKVSLSKCNFRGDKEFIFQLRALSLLLKKKLFLKMLAVTFDDNEDDNHVVLTRQR